jgi:hypothetical protein
LLPARPEGIGDFTINRISEAEKYLIHSDNSCVSWSRREDVATILEIGRRIVLSRCLAQEELGTGFSAINHSLPSCSWSPAHHERLLRGDYIKRTSGMLKPIIRN